MELNEFIAKIKEPFANFKKLLLTKPGSENDESIFPIPPLPEIEKFERSEFIWNKVLDDFEWRETDEACQLWEKAKTLREKADMIFSIFFSFYRKGNKDEKLGCFYNRLYYSYSVLLARTYFDCSWNDIMDEEKTAVVPFLAEMNLYSLTKFGEENELDIKTYKGFAGCILGITPTLCEMLHKIHGGEAPDVIHSYAQDYSTNTFSNDKNKRIYELQALLVHVPDYYIFEASEFEKKGLI